jgi:carboxyl-terminal processing protease
MEDNESYTLDEVSDYVRIMQEGLEYLDYKVNRTDGYFDNSTVNALKQFEKDKNILVDGILDKGTFEVVISSVIREYSLNESKDIQLNTAIDLISADKE